MILEPDERSLFSKSFEELVGRYFTSHLGIPPPNIKFYEMTPHEYIEKVFEYTYTILKPRTPRTHVQTDYEIRQNIELKTALVLIKPIELLLKLVAPKEIA